VKTVHPQHISWKLHLWFGDHYVILKCTNLTLVFHMRYLAAAVNLYNIAP